MVGLAGCNDSHPELLADLQIRPIHGVDCGEALRPTAWWGPAQHGETTKEMEIEQ